MSGTIVRACRYNACRLLVDLWSVWPQWALSHPVQFNDASPPKKSSGNRRAHHHLLRQPHAQLRQPHHNFILVFHVLLSSAIGPLSVLEYSIVAVCHLCRQTQQLPWDKERCPESSAVTTIYNNAANGGKTGVL